MTMRILIPAAAVLTLALAASPAHAGAFCQRLNTSPAPLPAALVPEVEKVFGIRATDPGWVERSTVVRCMEGRLLACNMGANLPCGKANTATTMPAADAWCRQYPNSDFIPAYITGHDSSEQWRCRDGAAATTGKPAPVDAQGYLTEYWEILPSAP